MSLVGRPGFQPEEFGPMVVAPGVIFRYLPESKWKTLSINVFLKIPINEERFTSLALVPRLNSNGTRSLPSLQHIARFLESMYGGHLGSDASKVGPVQVIRFTIEIPSPKYLNSAKFGEALGSIEAKTWSFLWDIVGNPYLENEAYPERTFEIEREDHRRDIIGLINNPPSYAVVRLIEEISRGDRRGLPPWGSLERLASADPAVTWNVWKETLSTCPISIYAIGEGADKVGEIVSRNGITFPAGRLREIVDISEELKPPVTPEEVVRVEEGFPGRQTVISMAFDTGVSPKDPEFPVLLFLDGLLGGFPHSKIFSVVREKENLAYFADTIVDAWRGLVIAIAGISDRDKDRVEDLIASQMDVLRHGDISDEEMDNTRKGLIRRLRTEADYQGTIINRMLNHEILGGARTGEEIVGDVSKVTKDDVISLANKTELKAVYVLRAEGDTRLLSRLPTLRDPLLDEQIHAARIYGMNVFILPKPAFQRQYAEVCVNYGSNDTTFIPHGSDAQVSVPAGVAHFLEHKMFEKPWGDAFSAFASFGASANAYTTNNSTSYQFWSLDNYDKGLALLMEVVFAPYFTKESVEKEKNIIAQEISMYEDQPEWRIFRETLGRLYKEHPVRLDIAGTYESIQAIDEDLLYMCHKNFYCPENATLFIAGDFEPDEILELAQSVIEKHVDVGREPPIRIRPNEPPDVSGDVRINLPVPTPLLNIGWKDNHLLNGRELLRREMACAFFLDITFGKSSDFFAQVHKQGLTDNLSFSYEAWPDYAFSIVGAESENPDVLNEMILEEVNRVGMDGVDAAEFERKRRAALGRFITVFSSFESVGMSQIRLSNLGENLFSYGSILESLDISDIDASMDCLAQGMKVSVIVANEG